MFSSVAVQSLAVSPKEQSADAFDVHSQSLQLSIGPHSQVFALEQQLVVSAVQLTLSLPPAKATVPASSIVATKAMIDFFMPD